MKRLLTRAAMAAGLATLLISSSAPAQDWPDPGDRARTRAEERQQRREERRAAREARRAEWNARWENWQFDADNAHILFGRDYTLPEGSHTSEGIVVVGGDAKIDGEAGDDVLVVGGDLTVGPKAIIHGDVSMVGGTLTRDPAARIDGEVSVAHVDWPRWSWSGWPWMVPGVGRFWWAGAALAFTVGRFFLVLLLSLVLISVAPRLTHSIASRFVAAPGTSAIAGFGAEILFAPVTVAVVIALVITIVGIVLLAALPFVFAGFALLWITGYAAIAALLGARLRGADWYVNGLRPIDVVVGSVMLSGLTLAGQVLMLGPSWTLPFATMVKGTGWAIEYLAWTVALGAALTAWVRRNGFDSTPVPPPIPPLPTPAPSSL